MKWLMIPIGLFLFLSGCRFSVSAEKLQLSGALDQTAYLSDEDPTTYTDEPAIDPDTTD